MARYSDVVYQDKGETIPYPGVNVVVRNAAAPYALAGITDDNGGVIVGSAVSTDSLGSFAFNASSGSYLLQYLIGGTVKRQQNVVIGQEDSRARDELSVNDFGAVGDGTTDNTAAINKAILAVSLNGGGTVQFGAASGSYRVVGPVILAPNVQIDGCGQILTGDGFASGQTMFVTGTVEGGVLTSNLGSPAETKIVGYDGVRNMQVQNTGIAFHFRNYNYGCAIENVHTFAALQFGVFERCFYMSLDNCSARGSSDATKPTFHFKESNNLINLRRVSATTASPFKFEGGSTGVTLTSCSGEGGIGTGVAFKDDCLGFTIDAGYWEAIQGTLFDFTQAGVCSVTWRSNYINLIETIFDDGSGSAVGTLFGTFDDTNYVANVGTLSNGFTYHGNIKVAGARNFIKFELPYANDAALTVPSNWTIGKNTRISQQSGTTGTSLTDIRARPEYFGDGIVPVAMGGDVGTSFAGTVPGCAISFPTGGSVTATITTKAKWQANELFTRFRFSIIDDSGTYVVYGETFGDVVKQGDTSGKTVAVANSGGFLRFSIAGLANVAGNRSITGRFQIDR